MTPDFIFGVWVGIFIGLGIAIVGARISDRKPRDLEQEQWESCFNRAPKTKWWQRR